MYSSQTVKSHIKNVLIVGKGPCTIETIEGVLAEVDGSYKGANILGELNDLYREREIVRDIRYWTDEKGKMDWLYTFHL